VVLQANSFSNFVMVLMVASNTYINMHNVFTMFKTNSDFVQLFFC
jgi:hypothetical protein